MSLSSILIIVLVLLLVGVLPVWPHAQAWGPGPSGIVGVIVLVLVIMLVFGKL